ncbi:MAG: c-type cytochrome [Thermoleophilia bacterium]|nr:c-type cytochrome [Thermoleophilia bacterium]
MSMKITRPRRRAAALTLAAVGASFALAACGDTGGDAAAGKKKFATCAGCHTLADAGSTGSSTPSGGPNLDDAFRQARQAGFEESQMAGVVHRWIFEAQPPMPRDLVTGQDAKDIAAYVASVAGKDEQSAVQPSGKETPQVTPVRFLN